MGACGTGDVDCARQRHPGESEGSWLATVSQREKTSWALAHESAARAAALLLLDVDELDLANRRAVVRRKGGAADVITWQTRTARLSHRYVGTRTRVPPFVTDRAADVDPGTGRARLSYRRAAELFGYASGGWTLHELRRSALTHAAEEGAPIPMLMTKSGHTPIRSLSLCPAVGRRAGTPSVIPPRAKPTRDEAHCPPARRNRWLPVLSDDGSAEGA
ncbi:integrase [Saccharopolyspora lacisalsi]|uniref:Integrase n=1 Tax=Halosaccharopolyspora lacisalsi TaxID=1000566 RepID=A0A839DZ91_9PSEU|nr:tyrosine-type recombinase/integrase [Halosaccharopolyspora lacisalsi]MBA8824715.1 integrase [Halosaccharopolyspora lacisalsi]